MPVAVDARRVASEFGMPRVPLLNDLEAMAYAVPVLREGKCTCCRKARRCAAATSR